MAENQNQKYWLNTREYQATRQQRMDQAMLGRCYYEGNPYEISALSGHGIIRLNVLNPLHEIVINEKTGDAEYAPPGYTYDYNIAKLRIDEMVAMILPDKAEFFVDGIDDDDQRTKTIQLLEIIADLGPKYPSTPAGIKQWIHALLIDIAQTSDGLLVPRYIPKNDRQNGHVRINWNDFHTWDAELDEQEEEVQFYRIEEKIWGTDGKAYWHRFDIWADKVIRYQKKTAIGDPDWHLMFPGQQEWENLAPHYFAGPMDESPISAVVNIESEVLKKVNGLLPVPVRYDERSVKAFRGAPECWLPDYRSIDKANLHFCTWSAATEETNFPALTFWDAVMPKNRQGETLRPDFRAGSQHALHSTEPGKGKAAYPDNIPTEFGFGDFLEQCLQIAFAHVPYMGRTPADLRAFSELSGYAHNVIYKMMRRRAKQIRDRAIENGVMVALQNALALADAKNILPKGFDANKIRFKMIYPDDPVTADEALKQTINVEAGLRVGVPPENVVNSLPFPITDRQAVVDAISEKQEAGLEMQEAMQSAKAVAGSLKDDQDGTGIDNQAGQTR